MSGIVIAALILVLLFAICIIDYSARRVRESAEELRYKASRLSMDLDAMSGYIMTLRDQIERLSKTLNDVEKDLESNK